MTQLLVLYPKLDRKLLYTGLLLKVFGFIGASFATSVRTISHMAPFIIAHAAYLPVLSRSANSFPL
jgi:hypothetical protein